MKKISIIDEYSEKIIKELDEKRFEFLNSNGYKIDKPYTIEKILELIDKLKRDGKKITHQVVTEKVIPDDETGEYKVIYKIEFKLEDIKDKEGE